MMLKHAKHLPDNQKGLDTQFKATYMFLVHAG